MSNLPSNPGYYDKLEKARLLEAKLKLQIELPHLYGWKWYKWAREFFESRNHYNFLVAANQISKSSTQIRKCIHWATAVDLWPGLWATQPLQFWYLYPSKEVATIEFYKKWVPQFLPRGEMKAHPVYGWREEKKDKYISALHFNSGVSVYFKTYGQDVQELQTGTVDAIFCDEELVEELYSELNMRIQAVEGYFHMVFTATLGQEFWRETMEERGTKFERFPDSFKQQVSMYDCLFYEDGTRSHWTEERIQRIKNSCKSDAEIQKRVYGRFILIEGRKYPAFDKKRHMGLKAPLDPTWHVYVAVDPGGGGDAHPAAICFVALSPDCKRGRVFRGWRGDGGMTTTSDVYLKYLELKGGLDPVGKFYDYASKDFAIIQSRSGDNFQQADKSHERGEQIIGVLFKSGMLTIDSGDPELEKLANELSNLRVNTPKTKAKDDFCDALRYCVVKMPWDWSAIPGIALPGDTEPRAPGMGDEERERRGLTSEDEFDELMGAFSVQEELDSINELYEA